MNNTIHIHVKYSSLTSELNGRSKELNIQLMNDGHPPESKKNSAMATYLLMLVLHLL